VLVSSYGVHYWWVVDSIIPREQPEAGSYEKGIGIGRRIDLKWVAKQEESGLNWKMKKN
jgi:hypothetical protein